MGGGAKNKYLVQLIQENTSAKIYIPDEELIDFVVDFIVDFLVGTNFCVNRHITTIFLLQL